MREYKKFIIAGVVLLVLGLMICFISLMIFGFGKMGLSSTDLVTNEHVIEDSFENITINGDTENIDFVLSEDGECKVVCFEDNNEPHNVSVFENTLTINTKKKKRWDMKFNLQDQKIKVYLPDKAYGKLIVDSDKGDVTISKNLIFDDINIELDTGDVMFDGCDARTINVETDTGDIKGTLLSGKEFNAKSDLGKVDVPKGKNGGLCRMITDTGDIVISVIQADH